MKLTRTVAPAAAITLADAKKQTETANMADHDEMLNRLIQAAQDFVEGPAGMNLALGTQTWELSLDCFPSVIRIPIEPVQSITSITYIDPDGNQQTLADFDADTKASPALIAPVSGSTFPQTKRQFNAVTVTFEAGFNPVPEDIRAALLLLVAHWFENREAVTDSRPVPQLLAFERIMNKYAVRPFA